MLPVFASTGTMTILSFYLYPPPISPVFPWTCTFTISFTDNSICMNGVVENVIDNDMTLISDSRAEMSNTSRVCLQAWMKAAVLCDHYV